MSDCQVSGCGHSASPRPVTVRLHAERTDGWVGYQYGEQHYELHVELQLCLQHALDIEHGASAA